MFEAYYKDWDVSYDTYCEDGFTVIHYFGAATKKDAFVPEEIDWHNRCSFRFYGAPEK